MDYLKYYQLASEPFRNDPDDRFYFESDGQCRARLRLLRGIEQRKGLLVLVGEPGCGKTTLAHHLRENLSQDECAVCLISVPHSSCADGWLLPRIASALGLEVASGNPLVTLNAIAERLSELGQKGRHPVLLIDEAQLLENRSACEELRGLLNLAHGGRKSLSIVLFGLHALDDVLRLDTPLAQRVDIRLELAALDAEQVRSYLEHRLRCSGATLDLFSEEAITALQAYALGVPRVINTLADNTLFEGYLNEVPQIDASLVAHAAQELGLAGHIEPGPSASGVDDVVDAPEPPLHFMEEQAPAISEYPEPEADCEATSALDAAEGDALVDALFDVLRGSAEVPDAVLKTREVAEPTEDLDALFAEIQIPD